MISYRDKTFCISPKCKNECGRQLTEFDKADAVRLELPISCGFFCGMPEASGKYQKVGAKND